MPSRRCLIENSTIAASVPLAASASAVEDFAASESGSLASAGEAFAAATRFQDCHHSTTATFTAAAEPHSQQASSAFAAAAAASPCCFEEQNLPSWVARLQGPAYTDCCRLFYTFI